MLCRNDNLINDSIITMARITKITSGLSVTATVLAEACSNSGSG